MKHIHAIGSRLLMQNFLSNYLSDVKYFTHGSEHF